MLPATLSPCSGHQGSSALADSLASDPAVFIPGFEPLDYPGLTAAQKIAFMEAAFTFPADAARFGAWRQELLRGKRVDRAQVQQFAQLAGKTVAGFKMRPYILDGGTGGDGNSSGSGAGNSTVGSRMHTAASGLSPAALRALLERYDVRVVLTLRRNRLKEALSWYKARELGIHQFSGRGKAAAAAAAVQAATAAAGSMAELQPTQQQHTGRRQQGQAGPLLQAGGLADGAKLPINITKLRDWLEYADAVNAALREAAAACRRPTITVWYEDFLADPLGQARRAAAFVGAPHAGAHVRLSDKYRKAGPDEVHAWVSNYQARATTWLAAGGWRPVAALQRIGLADHTAGSEGATCDLSLAWGLLLMLALLLLLALVLQELCEALRRTPYYQDLEEAACGTPSLAAADESSREGSAGHSRADLAAAAGTAGSALAQQPGELLGSWCVEQDMAATGWAGLSDEACMQKVQAVRDAAVAAVRDGNGTLLFKHVHKVSSSQAEQPTSNCEERRME